MNAIGCINNLVTISQGIGVGYSFCASREKEQILLNGDDHFYERAGLQAIQVMMSQSIALSALRVFGKQVNQPFALSFSYLVLPYGLAFLAKNIPSTKPLLNRTVNFLHKNLGNISQGVAIISAVALFTLGNTVLIASGFSFVALHILQKQQLVNPKLVQIINITGFVTSTTYLLLTSPILIKLLIVCEVVDYVYKIRFAGKTEQKEIVTSPIIPITHSNFQNGNYYFPQVRKEHVKVELPPLTAANLELLHTIFEGLDWSTSGAELEEVLKNDKNWIERENKELSQEAYLKQTLNQIITNIQQGNVLGNSTVISLYYRNIADLLNKQTPQMQKICLIKLILTGGCVVNWKKFEMAEELYNTLKLRDKETPLLLKIRILLQLERDELTKTSLFPQLKDLSQVFSLCYGSFQKQSEGTLSHPLLLLICDSLGLSMLGAKNDTSIIIPAFQKFMFKFLKGTLIEPFWDDYESTIIVKAVENAQLKGFITRKEITSWWLDWTKRQNDMTEEQKESFLAPIHSNCKLYYLNAMLVEMGVFELNE